MRYFVLLLMLASVAEVWAGAVKPQAPIGELLITPESVKTIDELDDGGKPRPGFHYVRATGTITNVGKHAICADIQSILETTFNLEYFGAYVKFNDKPWSRIDQLLPDEHIYAEYTFTVKNGVEPLTLVFKQSGTRQGCSKKEPLPVAKPEVRFSISSIENVP